MYYIDIEKEARDNHNKMSYARNEGIEKIAIAMINHGYTDENIVILTKLPLIQVQQLRSKV